MNIYSVLSQDHDQLKQLIAEMEAANEDSEESRDELIDEFEQLLVSHSDAEEMVFYTPLRDNADTHDLIEASFEDHTKLTDALDALKQIGTESDKWEDGLAHVSGLLTKHVETEERDVFAKAKELFSDDDSEQMGKVFMEEKERIMAEL